MADYKDLFVRMVLLSWQSSHRSVDNFLAKTPVDDFDKEVAPGRNTIGWIIAHLASVNDDLLALYGTGDPVNAEMAKTFRGGQGKVEHAYTGKQMADYWKASAANINRVIAGFTNEEWFSRHTRISDEDFKNEPHRNRLNVLMNRAGHISYHMGQLALAADSEQ